MFISDLALDAALDYLSGRAEKLVVCSAQPTTYLEANSTYKLGEVALTAPDFSKANGDVSGRKLIMAGKTVTGTGTGIATHFALVNDTNSTLEFENTMTNVAIEAAGTQDTNPVDLWEIQDPA